MSEEAEVVVIGAGPAGAVTALALARADVDVVVVDRDPFPRFHIGESLTGEAGRMLRSLGLGPALEAANFPVKHGVEVFGATSNASFRIPVVGVDADGTRSPKTTWQVKRSDFDSIVLDAAVEAGARLVEGRATEPLLDGGTVVGCAVEGVGEIRSRMVVDASGISTWASRAGLASPRVAGHYDRQIAVFSHLVGADRKGTDDTIIVVAGPMRWAWFIPISDEVVSVGVVTPTADYRASGQSTEDYFTSLCDSLHPELRVRTAGATRAEDVRAIGNFSYQIADFSGPGWVATGDAHRFVDPIFSFGVSVAVHEGERIAAEIVDGLRRDPSGPIGPFPEFEAWAEDGIDVLQSLVDAFWNHPLGFGYLVHHQHFDDVVDLFAGRIYGIEEPSEGLTAIRRLAEAEPAAAAT